MARVSTFIKTTLLGGLLVILPVSLVMLLVGKAVAALLGVVAPLADRLPEEIRFPTVFAVVLLVAGCFAAGLLARSRAVRRVGAYCERTVLERIPGYTAIRSLTRRAAGVEEGEKFAPALAEIEDALVPAFVVEEHADGRYTVFVPAAPTPGTGAIYIMDRKRVHLVDVPFLTMVKSVSRWGAGSKNLVQAMR